VVGHLGGELRGAFVFGAARDDRGVRGGDVVDFEIEHGVFAGFAVALRRGEHETDGTGGEEGEVGAGVEKEFEAEGVAIERKRDGDVADGEGDLAQFGKGGGGVHGVGVGTTKNTKYTKEKSEVAHGIHGRHGNEKAARGARLRGKGFRVFCVFRGL